MRPLLTDKEEQILLYIAACHQNDGFPPSVREIAEHIELKSSSTVAYYLGQLVKKGYLTRIPGKPRAIRVVV